LFLLALVLTAPAFSADRWIEYRSGPLHVFSDAGDRQARERLTEMEQLRYVLGGMLGKVGMGVAPKNDLDPIWPIDVILFANAKAYGPHALSKPLIDGGSATLGAWTADAPLPRDLLRAITLLLVGDNAGRMPETIETALCDLFSTIDVKGAKVQLGAPLPAGELPPDRMRNWAKVQLLATNPEYSGKFRVYLNNLQQGGDEDLATRNAFGLSPAKLNEQVDAYLHAGKFPAVPVSGEALNPNRDFIEKPVPASVMDPLLAELGAGGKDFPPESPRGLLAAGTHPALELATKANPRWAEPHFRLAEIETNLADKIRELKIATTLAPCNVSYWQALAGAQTDNLDFADAEKSWSAAERAAPTDAERARIRQERAAVNDSRAAFEASDKRRAEDEKARELQRAKDNAAAEVHAAEKAANLRLGGNKPAQAPVTWWEEPAGEKVAGALSRVDCLNGPMRLTIQIDGGGTIKLMIRDPKHLTIPMDGKADFSCGVQRPARKIRLVFAVKADAKLDTVGDVLMVDFP
jgi:hypothetical protein